MKKKLHKQIIVLLLLVTSFTVNSQTLIHTDWGFQDFTTDTTFTVVKLTQEAIQATIDSASQRSGGAVVIIPAGEIILRTALYLKSNVKLRGTLDVDGNHLTRFIAEKDAFYNENDFSILRGQGIVNSTVENIMLDGNNNFASGISAIMGSHNVLIANNIVINIGIAKAETIEDSKNWPEYQKSPSAINGWQSDGYITVKNNVIMNVSKHGVALNRRNMNVQAGHFIVQNNRMDNCYMGMDISSTTRYVEVLGNEITDCLYGTKIVNTWDVIYHDNVVYDCDDTPWYDRWIGGWNDGTGVALIFQEATLNTPPLYEGESTLKNIEIKDNILSSVDGKHQWDEWGVANLASKITFSPDPNSSEAPSGGDVEAEFTKSVIECSGTVNFINISSGVIESVWDFGDGTSSTERSPQHTYKKAGKYIITLTVSNGDNSDMLKDSVELSFAELPIATDGERDGDGTVDLSATVGDGGVISWYEKEVGGKVLAIGENFTTPELITTTTYYVENQISTTVIDPKPPVIEHGGRLEKGAGGGYYEWSDDGARFGLQFNATANFILKSVKVYNGTSSNGSYEGERTFSVINTTGDTIAQKVVNIVKGEQRLQLDMAIPVGSGYKLLSDAKVGMWRENTGSFDYPYQIGDYVTIIGWANINGAKGTDGYYFFYDWEIMAGQPTCISGRVPVVATIKGGSVVEDINKNNINIYPNPTSKNITVNNLPVENCSIVVYNTNMQQVKYVESNTTSSVRINFNNLSSGIYFCKIYSGNTILKIQKVVVVR
jgi:PKD repeat protein